MVQRLKSEQSKKSAKEIKEEHQRLLQAYEIYNSLASGKMEEFKKVRDYLSNILEQLLSEGRICDGVLLASRIKSPASVVQNWKLGKDLYDVFGITLLTTTQQEMDEITSRLSEEKSFNVSSKKKMNETRGYEAIHYIFEVGEDDSKPKTRVECHMQTHEAYTNAYTHIFYKIRRKLNRDLTHEEEEQIAKKVQSMYDAGELAGYQLSGERKSRLPQMWVTGFNPKGKMEEQELDEDMTLKIMYPFLNISKKNPSEQKWRRHSTQALEEDEVEI